MLQSLQYFMQIADPESLYNLDENAFEHPGINIYWKDKAGKYLGSNNVLAKKSGFSTGSEMLGNTDRDLSWSCFAAELRANDEEIIFNAQSKSIIEPLRSSDNKDYRYYSLKSPLRTKTKKIVGVIGMSIQLVEKLIPDSIYQLDNCAHEELAPSNSTIDFSILSKRQRECLYYLVRGLSMKEIARIMHLSPRTVEHYLEAVKYKFNCNSRSELVMKATKHLIMDAN